MSGTDNFDLIVIGSGPGGYVAAIRAAQIGMKVAVVEKGAIGGTCLNVGCIPTKALYANAGTIHALKDAVDNGILSASYNLNLEAVLANKAAIVRQLSSGVRTLLKANKVQVLEGTGVLSGSKNVEVTDKKGMTERYSAESILLATGSVPAPLPALGNDLDVVIDSTGALALEEVPEHLLIVGAGVIGIEFAGIYQAFGSQVTVVEFMPDILPNMDRQMARRLQEMMEERGIRFYLSAKVTAVEKKDGRALVHMDTEMGKQSEVCDLVLSSTGRRPNTGGLNLEGAGVVCDSHGFVQVDGNYETSVKGIYAIGDIIPGPMLAHLASAEGIAAVEGMRGKSRTVDPLLVPQSVFSFPEFSSIGLSEEELSAQGLDYTVSRSFFAGNGKALTMHDAEGFIKVLATPDLETILGVHVLGPHANDLIAEAAVAMYSMLTVEEYSSVMRGHPTLPEAMAEAVDTLLGQAIHVMPKRRETR